MMEIPTELLSVFGPIGLLEQTNCPVMLKEYTHTIEFLRQLQAQGTGSLADAVANDAKLFDTLHETFTLVWCNECAIQLFEATDDADLISRLHEVYVPESVPKIVEYFESLTRGDESFVCDVPLRTLTGAPLHVRLTSNLVRMPTQTYSICSFSDVTDWYQAQQSLARLRSRYEYALRGTQLGVWEWNIAEQTVTFDTEYYRILGYQAGEIELTLDMVQEFIHVDDRNYDSIGALLAGKYERTFRMRCKDGKFRWMRTKGQICEFDKQGKPVRAIGTIYDDSLKQQEIELREVERVIFEASAEEEVDETFFTDIANGIDRAFPNFRSLVMVLDEHQQFIQLAVAPKLPEDFSQSLLELRVAGKTTGCQAAMRSKRYVFYNNLHDTESIADTASLCMGYGIQALGYMPIVDSRNTSLGTICLTSADAMPRPIEAIVALERVARSLALVIEKQRRARSNQLHELQLQNRQKFESLGKLAGGIAHDFNNLLTVIMTNTEYLQLKGIADNAADASQQGFPQIIQAANTAALLCKQMLTYAGKVESEMQPFDVELEVRKIMSLIRSATSPAIQIALDSVPDLPPIQGDPATVSQVIMNLLTNAVEAVDSAGTISIKLWKQDHADLDSSRLTFADSLVADAYVCITVTDDGHGIDEVTRRRMFDPFFSTKLAGRGLGLATVLGIVKHHAGGIELQTKAGEGTSFTVLLPASTSEVHRVDAAHSVSTTRCNKRVLIVDDQENVLAAISNIVELHGCTATPAQSGEAALERLRGGQEFDIVLLDQQMPGLSGLATYAEIRALHQTLPVCFVTGYVSPPNLDSLLRLDPNAALLRKPFSNDLLLSTLERLLKTTSRQPQFKSAGT
ncbi:PAS domain-containing hybrid sensor histidine kinase/response regulator [Aureliella helgolandensis]|uniref:histidine kinase n=1 Tax=Aureliella helgolandensis TaxID=2527968 RepID=A0A518G6X3_9BACT|nr:PAS domain-containing hybrid sensor histidine kinase/response regulator [Aureliella helgolandensis]QDV24334.1 Blue-light-activated protein [Aureliella helgolandensis]